MGGGRAVAFSIAQALPITLEKTRGSAVDEAVAQPGAFPKVLAFTEALAFAKRIAGAESLANARDNAIAQGIADSEIFPDSKAFPDPQTDSGAEA